MVMSPLSSSSSLLSTENRKDGTNFDHSHESQLYQKGVKNMFDNGVKYVPNKYILPAADRPNVVPENTTTTACPDLDIQLPVIDFAELQSPNRSQVIASLAYACRHFGFFQVGY